MRKVKFKVVHIETRGFRTSAYAEGDYSLDYPKGAIVRARVGTLGVAVFQTRQQARRFTQCFSGFRTLRVIRVRPVGSGKAIKVLSYFTSAVSIDSFYQKDSRVETRKPPPGTIFYPAVEVLD